VSWTVSALGANSGDRMGRATPGRARGYDSEHVIPSAGLTVAAFALLAASRLGRRGGDGANRGNRPAGGLRNYR
jgi:hypothetical protein